MTTSIQAVVDQITNSRATILINEDNKLKISAQQIIWPRELLAPNIKEGDVVALSILKQEDATKSKEEYAREMLNYLLDKK